MAVTQYTVKPYSAVFSIYIFKMAYTTNAWMPIQLGCQLYRRLSPRARHEMMGMLCNVSYRVSYPDNCIRICIVSWKHVSLQALLPTTTDIRKLVHKLRTRTCRSERMSTATCTYTLQMTSSKTNKQTVDSKDYPHPDNHNKQITLYTIVHCFCKYISQTALLTAQSTYVSTVYKLSQSISDYSLHASRIQVFTTYT